MDPSIQTSNKQTKPKTEVITSGNGLKYVICSDYCWLRWNLSKQTSYKSILLLPGPFSPLSRHKEAYHQKWKLQKCSVFLTNWRWWLVWKLPPPSAVGKHTELITSDWGRWRVCFQGTRKLNSTQKYKLQTDPSKWWSCLLFCCSAHGEQGSAISTIFGFLTITSGQQTNGGKNKQRTKRISNLFAGLLITVQAHDSKGHDAFILVCQEYNLHSSSFR